MKSSPMGMPKVPDMFCHVLLSSPDLWASSNTDRLKVEKTRVRLEQFPGRLAVPVDYCCIL